MYRKGSITVEASLIVPMFLSAMVLIAYLLNLTYLNMKVGIVLKSTCMKITSGTYPVSVLGERLSSLSVALESYESILTQAYVYNAVSQELHEDKLINEMIVGGSGGITFLNSSFMDDGQAVDIVAEYSIRLPFSEFGIPTLHFVQRARMHGWTGYAENSGNEAGREDDSVYVTDSGSVYHDKRDCIYLNPSVSAVDGSAVGSMRSTDGSIYYPCELCGASASLTAADTVYLTKSGNRFHTSKQCSGLKRTVFEIPFSEVGGRRPCSKCAAR